MNNFQLAAPDSRAATLELLAEHKEEARLIAGGTGLVNLMKQRLVFPEWLISLHRVPDLSGVAQENGLVSIGALTRLAELESHPIIREYLPMLCATLAQVASPRVRAMATLGGAVAHGDPHQDTPAALIALDARARVQSTTGQREVALHELYLDYYETSIEAHELITDICIPVPSQASAATYVKFLPRSAEDYATVAVAARLDLDPSSRVIEQCRIVLGSLGATPIRSQVAESMLCGKKFTAERAQQAAQRAAEDVDPMSDTRGSASYKRDMAVVFVRRALLDVASALDLDRRAL